MRPALSERLGALDREAWSRRLQLLLVVVIAATFVAAAVRGHAGAVLPALVGLVAGWLVVRACFQGAERGFLSILLLAAFAVRAIAALIVHPLLVTNVRREGGRFDTFVGFMFEDDRAFDVVSWALARFWSGQLSQIASSQDYLVNNYTVLMGGVYYLLGRDVMGPKLLNCLFGALAAVIVYALARELGGRRAGTFAALLMAFFPSLILWSILNLKDTLVIPLIALTMLGGLKFARRPSIAWAVVTILSFAALENLRLYVFFALGWLLWMSFFIVNRAPWRRRLAIGIPFALALLSVVYVTNESQQLGLRYLSAKRLEALASSREFGAREADTGIELENVPRTENGYTIQLRTAPTVLPYVLWGPFPWQASRPRELATIPETLAWYGVQALVIAAMLGYRRERWRELFLPVAFGGGLAVIFSLIEGNVGTIYRHRAMLLVPAFAVAGLGYVWVTDWWAVRRQRRVPTHAEAVA
ncbi:MAG: glycosyltransferase family 39 protein [Chloroflexota bacterium]|nr:glycosyltransferase family 39 protein [Chloroflexota bacterium]